jgi:hypothetical protein
MLELEHGPWVLEKYPPLEDEPQVKSLFEYQADFKATND